MPVFERSWQTRLVRGRRILPHIRDQGNDPTCGHHCVAGAVESAYKKFFAEIGQDFDKKISVDYLVFKLGLHPYVDVILSEVQNHGALTESGFEQFSRNGMQDHENVERIKIKKFAGLDPMSRSSDLSTLMTHVLLGGTAIGIFETTASFEDSTVYFEDVAGIFPIFSDSCDDDDDDDDDDDEEEEEEDDDDVVTDVDMQRFEVVVEHEDEEESIPHAVLLTGLGMDEDKNLYWKVQDSHGPTVGEAGTRRIAVNLMKEAYIVEVEFEDD